MSVTKVTDAMRNVTAVDATKLTGAVDVARLPSTVLNSNVPATDLSSVRQDIAMLALYNAVSDNRAAYNLPFSFIDQFEDDSGLTTQTDVDRNTDGEYVSSILTSVGAFSNDANTLLLLHMEDVGLTDSSSTGHVITKAGSAHRNTTTPKFGSYSMADAYITLPDHDNWDFGTSDYTIESWVRINSLVANFPLLWWTGAWGSNVYDFTIRANTSNWELYTYNGTTDHGRRATRTIPTGEWHHYAVSRTSSVTKLFYDGVEETLADVGSSGAGSDNLRSGSDIPRIGSNNWVNGDGSWDEFRVSNVGRYTSNFTPNEISTVSATGTLISDQQTAPALTKMSGVVLVKDGGSSTTVMGTHLKIYFSATGAAASFPSAWVEADSYTAVTAPFSTGVTMYKLGETTVPSGTLPTIRAVWASQTDGGFESQLHGWAMNY